MSVFAADSLSLSGTLLTVSGGQLYVAGQQVVAQTGVTGTSGFNAATYATVTNLGLTGQTLLADIVGLSGQSATASSLTQTGIALGVTIASTGQTLYGDVVGLSGQASATYATLASVTQTGVALGSTITSTGSALYADLTGASGQLTTNLATTGQTLLSDIVGLSGQAASTYAALTNVTTTGVNLGSQIAQTGSNIYVTLTGLSGQLNTNLATAVNLTTTGQTLQARITSLSGFVGGVSGALQAQIAGANGTALSVTGSAAQTTANLTGIGGALVFLSGGYVVVSGGAGGGGGGVPSVNSITSAVTIAGTGLIAVSTAGSTITISGDTSVSGALTTTGVTLGAQIVSLSGYAASSVNLASTGSNLYVLTTGLSGASNLTFATIANVTQTGVALGTTIGSTGSVLYIDITGMSGQLTTNLATVANLALTGSNLYVTLTGLSGQANANYAGASPYYTFETGKRTPIFYFGTANTNFNLASGMLVCAFTGSNTTCTGVFPNPSGYSGYWFDLSNNGTVPVTFSGVINNGLNLTLYPGDEILTFSSVSSWNVISNTGSNPWAIIKVTGSANLPVANLTGAGTTSVVYSAGQVIISGSSVAGTGAGVSTFNGAQNAVILTGTGGFTVVTIGQTTYISGLSTATGNQIVISSGGGVLGYQNFTWNPVTQTLGLGQGTGGATLTPTSRSMGLLTISGVGLAGKPGLSSYSTGWGNDYYQPAFYDNRTKFFSPNAGATQSTWGDTATNVGTLLLVGTEALGDYTQVTPAAGISAGLAATTASIFRGSQLGLNGFFFSSKFLLNTPWASGLNTSVYGNPSGCRIFVGLTDQAVATQTQLNEPIGNMIGVHYMWASGGAVGTGAYMQNWAIRSRDNVNTNTGDIGMLFQTGFYRFSMFCQPWPNNTYVQWEMVDLIRGSGVRGTQTLNLPVGSTALRPMVAIGFVSGLKTIGCSTLYVEKQGSLFD